MTLNQRRICVAEDDSAIRRGIADSLSFAGFQVIECADGVSTRRTLFSADCDLALLDVVLPGMDALDFLPELRAARPSLPVIFVTARGTEEDRVRGLRGGADDYVVKPFSATELLARVEAVLRRSNERTPDLRGLRFAHCEVDLIRREVRVRSEGSEMAKLSSESSSEDPPNKTRQLTEREAALLTYLARFQGRPVARRELLERVWGLNPLGIDTRTIDMTVARLRDKLGAGVGSCPTIVTVRGQGYMIGGEVSVQAEVS